MNAVKRTFVVIVLAGLSASAWGVYWVEQFSGRPDGYRVERSGKAIPVSPLMQLQSGDELHVLGKTGRLTLVGDNNERVVLGHGNTPFQVPTEAEPPEVTDNLVAWANDWWKGPKLKSLENVLAASRGAPPLMALATSYEANMLFIGKGSLVVRWAGGEGPFRVTLADTNEHEIAGQEEITERVVRLDGLDEDIEMKTARFTGLDLAAGNYVFKIRDLRSVFFVDLIVVAYSEKPDFVEELVAMPAPESIRWGYVAMRLAEQPQWRFQALQIAEFWKLDALAKAILTRG